jgi:dethiobiotin synthetase
VTVVGVAGTGTDIGKTWVTAACARILRTRGVAVAARKPAQSFTEGDTTDAEVLAEATGEDPHTVCPAHRWFAIPMAPPMAAAALGQPGFTVATLVDETAVPDTGITFVETAGGLRSPIATDGDCVAYLTSLRPAAVLLVADAGLGTINLVRLSVDALPGQRVVVYLNRFAPADDLHQRNAEWLRNEEGHEIVTHPPAHAPTFVPLVG